MKKLFVLPLFLALFAACSNPLLRWIDTSDNSSASGGGRSVSASDKAITGFSFGIPGEEVSIRANPGQDGTIPIKVILPENSGRTGLSPSITYIGQSIMPPGGIPQTANPYDDLRRSFEADQVYTVKAADGSEQKYTVQVYIKKADPAAIVWFDLEIPDSGGLMAEGVVTEGTGGQPGSIVLHVPPGTPLTGLTAKIAQTGTLEDPNHIDHTETAVTLTRDFSAATPEADRTYTVRSGSQARQYIVTVVLEKSGVKEITAFSFTNISSSVIIGGTPSDGKYPIVATVPPGTDINSLTPKITFTGASIAPPGGTAYPFNPDNPYDDDVDRNFSNPVSYRVRAEDESYRDYVVTVMQKNTGKQITGFYFNLTNSPAMGAVGIINETAGTIAVTVPSGTDLSKLSPNVYHTGVSVSPLSGEPKNFSNSAASPVPYTVSAGDGTTRTYGVTVFVEKKSDKTITAFDFSEISGETVVIGSAPVNGTLPIVVTVPHNTDLTNLTPEITHTGASITGTGISGTGGGGTVTGNATGFTSPAAYTVKAEDGTTQVYSVTVVKIADPTIAGSDTTATIDGFYFTSPMAAGTINEAAKTITVTVPYYNTDQSPTNPASLIPTIYYTGSKIKQGEAADPAPEQTTKPASIGADFTGSNSTPIPYTVKSQDDSVSATYWVKVSVAPKPLSDVREITALSFTEIPAADLPKVTVVIASTPDASGSFPIDVTVPEGTDISLLNPVITFKGASITPPGLGAQLFNPLGPFHDAARNFETGTPVYRVTAEDGQTRDYIVTVRVDDNNAKEITGFYFTNPVAIGSINQNGKTITVTVPSGTNLAALSPTVYYTGAVLSPGSGIETDFRSPVTYTVTARNGTSASYTVRVVPKPASTKEISSFTFPGAGVLDTVIGAIPGSDGNLPISITVSENTTIGALTPLITHTGVSIGPASGTVQDFRSPVTYQVSAEDGSTQNYDVTVHIAGGGAKVITGFVFKAVPLSGGQTVSVIGEIDQESHTIKAVVPNTADISGLVPTLSYIGASITPPGGAAETDNPFTDTNAPSGRDFSTSSPSSPLTYTVTAGGEDQEYKVWVEMIPELTVRFDSIEDPSLIEESFDQSTGLLTITIDQSATVTFNGTTISYTFPYEWYLDGKKYPVPGTETSLVLKTWDLAPGRHELVLIVTGSDNKHYSNKMYFLVQEGNK